MQLDTWIDTVVAELDLRDTWTEASRDVVLDLVRDVAHTASRPGAPITAFLLGIAVGQGGELADLAARVRALLPERAAEPQ